MGMGLHQHTANTPQSHPEPALARSLPTAWAWVLEQLSHRSFFKLIMGGSFSALDDMTPLLKAYTLAGVDMIDVSADWDVVNHTITVLKELVKEAPSHRRPLLMASFPLDDDPHFRKILLNRPDCIDCGVCIDVCPTEVFDWDTEHHLQLDTPRCYGCGRCVPVCPTNALDLESFSAHLDRLRVLSSPDIDAVEIHSHYADPLMVGLLWNELGPLLSTKWIAVCFRPQEHPLEQNLAFIQAWQARVSTPLIIQVDGDPMSGSDDPQASLPALEAAKALAPHLDDSVYLTISGGINVMTAEYLKQPEFQRIQGVGMGTMARKAVWEQRHSLKESTQLADTCISAFRSQRV